jgi:hypothetical protein
MLNITNLYEKQQRGLQTKKRERKLLKTIQKAKTGTTIFLFCLSLKDSKRKKLKKVKRDGWNAAQSPAITAERFRNYK